MTDDRDMRAAPTAASADRLDFAKLQKHIDAHPYPLVFATISGAHLYGFPSADSDFDLRGVHLHPASRHA